jgi:hypothetical protein
MCGKVIHVTGKGGRRLIDIQPDHGTNHRSPYSKKR